MPLFRSEKKEHYWIYEQLTGQEVSEKYDTWAADYDQELAQWEYRSPHVVATLITQHLALEGKILDAGCGTGLSGKALQTSGIQQIIGIDVSEASLKRARQTGVYERLLRVDLCQRPLPFTTDAFVGLSCVGVLAYLHQTEAIMREFCRVVRPDGIIVFTQREDVFYDRRYPEVITALEQEQVWRKILVSEPELYLPGNEEFGAKIRVINCVFRVTS